MTTGGRATTPRSSVSSGRSGSMKTRSASAPTWIGALARPQVPESSWGSRRELCDLWPGVSARSRLADRDREKRLHAGKSIRRQPDVLPTALLRFDGVATVVGGDAVEGSVGEIAPELLDLLPITDRRGAFGEPGQPHQIIMVEREILRAGLGRDADAARLRLASRVRRRPAC